MNYLNRKLFLPTILTLLFGSFYCSAMEEESLENKNKNTNLQSSQTATLIQENSSELDQIEDPLIRAMGPQTLNRAIALAKKSKEAEEDKERGKAHYYSPKG